VLPRQRRTICKVRFSD